MIRSFIFVGLTMLAAAFFLHAPAMADIERSLDISTALEAPDILIMPEVAGRFTAVAASPEAVPKAGFDAHAVIYGGQNQPLSSWRLAVDAYSRIDPHILKV